jgi:hypothetical protein
MRPLTQDKSIEQIHAEVDHGFEVREQIDDVRTKLIEALHRVDLLAGYFMEQVSDAAEQGIKTRDSETLDLAINDAANSISRLYHGEFR